MSDHDHLRDLAGPYVLGALDQPDRTSFESHLLGCPRCRDELIALAPIPGLLAKVPLEDLDTDATTVPDAAIERARAHLSGLRASRRRWRRAATSTAAAALVLLGAAIVDGDGASPPPERDRVTLVLDAAPSVAGTIAADERAWGTYLHLALEGLPHRDRYRMWVLDDTGEWYEAGSWLPTPEGRARLGGSTHLRLADIVQVVVTSDRRADQVLVAVPG